MSELRSSSPFQGIELHVYGYKEDCREKRRIELDTRPAAATRLGIAAARQLIEKGEAEPNVIVSGREMLGQADPVSTMTAREIQRMVPGAVVYTNPTAQVSTLQELRFARETARAQGLDYLVSIGWGIHTPRIETLGKKVFGPTWWDRLCRREPPTIAYRSTEEILSTYPNEKNQARYQALINLMHALPPETKWKAYEKKLQWVSKIPFGAQFADQVAKIWRPKAD
ncbi:MAG TPA: hypothetical protein VG935_00850 [Patescibacteria group bacterium]|nr:hypothetical protein [Patescibacteria group bacterium]